MKKIIITLLILSTFLIGCSKGIEASSKDDTTVKTVTVTSTIEDTAKIEELEKQLSQNRAELEKYHNLIANLNELLKHVYYGYARNDKYESDGFTAFSMEYNRKYYLITVGHAVHYKTDILDSGKMTNFKFKANFSDKLIYPKLLAYNFKDNTEGLGKDYAVFYSDKINDGFKIGQYDGYNIILGSIANNLNLIRFDDKEGIDGECGSPVINLNGEVTAVYGGVITQINKVTDAIDNLK